jgi:hypothetical protein
LKTRHLGFLLLLATIISSCNVYSPLNSKGSTQAYLEEAQKCLHNSDFACAIENYNALPDSDLKKQKLCMTYLSQGGIKLTSLINILPKNDATMLGALANTLPWSATRSTALDSAKTVCATYVATAASGDTGVLLNTISLLGHCAVRMAKTRSYRSIVDGDACDTANTTSSSTVESTDLGAADGTVSAASPGMCKVDAEMCVTDIAGISSTALTGSGLTNISSTFDLIPAELKDTSTAATVIRLKLQTLVSD